MTEKPYIQIKVTSDREDLSFLDNFDMPELLSIETSKCGYKIYILDPSVEIIVYNQLCIGINRYEWFKGNIYVADGGYLDIAKEIASTFSFKHYIREDL